MSHDGRQLRDRTLPARRGRSLLREHGMSVDVMDHEVSQRASSQCASLFLAGIRRAGLRYVERRECPRRDLAIEAPEALGRVELSWRGERHHDVVVWPADGVLALVTARFGHGEAVVAAGSPGVARAWAKRLAAALRQEPEEPEDVEVTFWACERDTLRRAAAPRLRDIRHNYPAALAERLADLAAARSPGDGALLLWHGAPGTGKSYALRALLREWRSWCSAHYITDPERFLGSGTSYLMNVLDEDDDERWQLLILEDAGELIAADARAATGQALSRLLNVTDGLLGQGARALLLITTNEPIGRLHPAVRRPGRCWVQLEFGPLRTEEACAWLARRDGGHAVDRPHTLAELYALVEGRDERQPAAEPFGFARGLAR